MPQCHDVVGAKAMKRREEIRKAHQGHKMAFFASNNSPVNEKTRKKGQGLSHPDGNSEFAMGKPIDYSFKHISSISDLDNSRPSAQRVGGAPSRGASNRFVSASIWLNNNELTSAEGLAKLVHGLVEQPKNLAWIDLSFNKITDIHDDILQFEGLKILYLHRNEISNLCSIAKLRHLEKLTILTLRGNPLEQMPSFRGYIISLLPKLQRLDNIPISQEEKGRAPPAGFAKKKAMLLK